MSIALDPSILPQLLEALMLICFGVAWPINLLQMLRQGRAAGKSLAFTLIIWSGYLAGTVAKLVGAELGHTALPPVFWLYVLNSLTVGANAWVQGRLESARRGGRAAVAPAALRGPLAG